MTTQVAQVAADSFREQVRTAVVNAGLTIEDRPQNYTGSTEWFYVKGLASIAVGVTKREYYTVVQVTVNPTSELRYRRHSGLKTVIYWAGQKDNFQLGPVKLQKVMDRLKTIQEALATKVTAEAQSKVWREESAQRHAVASATVLSFITEQGFVTNSQGNYRGPLESWNVSVGEDLSAAKFSAKLGNLTEAQMLAVLAVLKG